MKKSKIFFSLIVFLGMLGLAVFGYLKAVPGPEDDQTDLPKIEIAPVSYNFGEIVYKDVVRYNFKIKNQGNMPLEITRVATSCGCTTAKALKTSLAPAEETELQVVYESGQMTGSHGRGEQERIIYVKSNDPVNPQVEVLIYGTVR